VATGRHWWVALTVPGWLVVLAVARRRIRGRGSLRAQLSLVSLAVLTLALFGTALLVLP
jgi:hypothetical protein